MKERRMKSEAGRDQDEERDAWNADVVENRSRTS